MVLVPSYLEVDGLVVPLQVYPPSQGRPAGIGHAEQSLDSPLAGFRYVIGELLSRPPEVVVELLTKKRPIPLPEGLAASPVTGNFVDYAEQADRWTRLTGTSPDLSDVYYVGANFVRAGSLVIPRATFIALMRRLYELDAAVREGRVEARIDESIPIPPRRRPPPAPAPRWADDELREIDGRLATLDAMDPLGHEAVDVGHARRVARLRGSLFALLEIAWRWTRDGVDDMSARYRALGLRTLIAYEDATEGLLAYLHDPDRLAITTTPPPDSPFDADVSVDMFRLPPAPQPPGSGRHVWLAQAEAAFVAARRPNPGASAGELFTRVGGQMIRLRYRSESGAHYYLWRVELA